MKKVLHKSNSKTKFGKIGFVLGIVAIATAIFIIGGLVAIPGIVFSAIGMKSEDQAVQRKAKIGLILSIIAAAIAIIIAFVGGYFLLKFLYEFGGHPIGF